jgi:predicted HicB family RNase H-like nuclease
MTKIVEIDGHRARIDFDPDIEMLRGEFLDLRGGADFYATDIVTLIGEGRQSLAVYREICRENSIALD